MSDDPFVCLLEVSGDLMARFSEHASLDLTGDGILTLSRAFPEFSEGFWERYIIASGARDKAEALVACTSFLQGYELARRRAEA